MKSKAQYRQPPVVEVVTGLVFEPISELTIGHYGRFWQLLAEEFPQAKHAFPIGLGETVPSEPFFIPRLWLINRNQDALLQLQANRFYFNWREGPNRSKYTSYTVIYPQFVQYWKRFLQFLRDANVPQPPILKCELTYINHLPTSAGWTSMTDVGNVVTPLAWAGGNTGFLPTPKTVTWNASFDLPDSKGSLTVKMKPAYRGQEKELILVLELAATGATPETSDQGLEAWFETAHEWIVKGFEDMTDPKVQRSVWGKA